jgi:hypothetical protein
MSTSGVAAQLVPPEFGMRARAILTSAPWLDVNSLGDLAYRSAYWHPYGFAVFQLDDLPIGRVRLHVWPKGMRHGLPKHPPVHCHDWHLTSRVLAGVYKDAILDGSLVENGRYPVSRVETREGRYDEFVRLPNLGFELDRETPRAYPRDGIHDVPAGTFHRSRISASEFCATLVVTSAATPAERMIVGLSSVVSRDRLAITPSQLSSIDRQYLAANHPNAG